jgi:DNA end-binding protein Ku
VLEGRIRTGDAPRYAPRQPRPAKPPERRLVLRLERDDIENAEAPTAAEEQLLADRKPEQYKDTYRDALCEVIEAKRKGKEIHIAAQPEEEEPTDLMAALRASLEAHQRGREPTRASRSPNGAGAESLDELSKGELEERAREAEIEGRSKMSKQELIKALRSAA